MLIHSEKAATCRPGRGLSQEPDYAGCLISDFSPSQMGENKLLLLKLKEGRKELKKGDRQGGKEGGRKLGRKGRERKQSVPI